MDYTAEALGLEIKDLRERRQMSQESLGDKAGYGKGAGVSISRIESGSTRPSMPRLAGIAGALGVTPERLEELANGRSNQGRRALDPGSGAVALDRTVKVRLQEVQKRTELRTERVNELGSSLKDAHDRARDAYFLRFISIANGIEGAPPREVPTDEEPSGLDDSALDVRATAAGISILSSKITDALVAAAGAALGGAAGYATFTGVARLGTASTGAAISGLSGIAATNATLAVLGGGTLAAGGGGIAAGTRLLTAIVVAPIGILAAGGVFLAHRQSKAQELKLSAELDVAEQALEATQTGFDLLADTLSSATAILEYIGVHAAHALEKWEMGLGPRPISWGVLTAEQQQSYREFTDIAACQLAVDNIEAAQFMTSEGEALENLTVAITRTLDYADKTVRTLV